MHVVPGGKSVFPWELASRPFWAVGGGANNAADQALVCHRALAMLGVRCFEAGRDFPARPSLRVDFCSSLKQ